MVVVFWHVELTNAFLAESETLCVGRVSPLCHRRLDGVKEKEMSSTAWHDPCVVCEQKPAMTVLD